MKKLAAFLLVLLLLFSGCTKPAEQQTTDNTATTTAVATESTTVPAESENTGLYVPDSAVEMQTKGAVREYNLEGDANSIALMGENLVMFSGYEVTDVTLLSGDQLEPGISVELNGHMITDSLSYFTDDQGLVYYEQETNSIVFRNAELQETSRIALPEEIENEPVVARDRGAVYYTIGNSIYGMDLKEGISRFIGRQNCSWQTLGGIFWNDNILCCHVCAEDGTSYTQYISAETGETVWMDESLMWLDTAGDVYCAKIENGLIPEYVFGGREDQQSLTLEDTNGIVYPMPEMDGLLNVRADDASCDLEFYSFTSGKKTSAIHLNGVACGWSYVPDPKNERIWFLATNEAGENGIYRWDLNQSSVTDSKTYTTLYYTEENPDDAGLEAIQKDAEALEEKYHIDLVLWKEARQMMPGDYEFQLEYKVPAYREALKVLDAALDRYPEGFFEKAAAQTDSGVLHISLVRGINGVGEDALSEVGGLQYWLGNEVCIALSVDTFLEQTFYHELFHLMDNRIICSSSIYDDWNSLNPKEFDYDYDYIENQLREDYQYLEGDNRAFIDMYSMSYPGEDRARLMEYAMMPDNVDCFTSEIMQNKLRKLCAGIRECFDLGDYQEKLPWEVYLEENLNPME